MKDSPHRLPQTDFPDDWVDGTRTVYCTCGFMFDNGEEMASCDECGFCVHTRCYRLVKGETSFACHNCKTNSNNNVSNSCKNPHLAPADTDEAEIAQILIGLSTKTDPSPSPNPFTGPAYMAPFRMRAKVPMDDRVHVQGEKVVFGPRLQSRGKKESDKLRVFGAHASKKRKEDWTVKKKTVRSDAGRAVEFKKRGRNFCLHNQVEITDGNIKPKLVIMASKGCPAEEKPMLKNPSELCVKVDEEDASTDISLEADVPAASQEKYGNNVNQRVKEEDSSSEDKVQHQQLQRYRSNMSAINEDIIFFEILARLPVGSLRRCKAVCRSWYNRISDPDPSFVCAHLDHSKKKRKLGAMPLILMQWMIDISRYEEQDTCFSLFWKELAVTQGRHTQVCHSNGLLLVDTEDELLICNPSTRDFNMMPKGGRDSADHLKPRVCGFGFVPGTNVLKIARYFYRWIDNAENTCSTGMEVFTVGVDTSWRVMAKDPPYPVDFGSYAPICANGAVYFQIDNSLHSSSKQFILSFDLRDEEFSVIPPPSSLSGLGKPNADYRLIGLDDAPCVVYEHPEESNKHTICLYKEHTWIHLFTFQLPQGRLIYPHIALRDKKLLLHVSLSYIWMDRKWELFDPESKSFETVANITEYFSGGHGALLNKYIYTVLSYVESLQPAGPRKKKLEI